MRFCKKCKVAAKPDDAVCPKCKGPLSQFGSAGGPTKAQAPLAPPAGTEKPPRPSPAAPGAPVGGPGARPVTTASPIAFSLGGKIQELEEIKRHNLKRGRNFGLASLLVALAILVLLYSVYSRTVLAYAVLENIKLEQDPIAESQITVSFDVKTPGKVAFDRRSGTGHTEKVDLIAGAEHHETVWSWPSDPKSGIDFSVVSRGGWFRTTTGRHFDVSRDRLGVEVVFLLDITSSMGPFINGLKQQCIGFADQIRRAEVDCQLGLIAFGDVDNNEPIRVFEPMSDVKKFQTTVARLQLADGGDPPESSVEALERALEIRFRPHTRVCFVHITDADCHNKDRIPNLADALEKKQIITYVISRRVLRGLYEPLCVNGGSFQGINDAPFDEILESVATSIYNQIKSD